MIVLLLLASTIRQTRSRFVQYNLMEHIYLDPRDSPVLHHHDFFRFFSELKKCCLFYLDQIKVELFPVSVSPIMLVIAIHVYHVAC